MGMVNIEINGIKLQARPGAMVIEVADEAGIVIPRFCYHKKLSIAANCRMCLVEVEKVAKPLPACATPVTEGMKVFTRSPKAIAAQRAVMEFLLINHPLDCPICDQGGECDLQEMAMGFGGDVSRYSEGKRVVGDRNIGPLIATDMTRCIHCTRCVRFGQEIAGMFELGATGRGEHTRIGTYVADTVDSEISGNVIDLCPVGALTSKPYRYSARPWELVSRPSISPHDCVGANLRVDVRNHEVMRVVPRENEAVNENWLADRDRFAYLGLTSPERVTTPMIKHNGQWATTDWDTALTFAADGLKRALGPRLGAWAGYTATLEEMYLLQKLVRAAGSGNVDHRLRQVDFREEDKAPLFPWLGMGIAELEQLDAALLIGSNLRKEQPLLGQRLRKAALKGARIQFVNPQSYPLHFPAQQLAAGGDLVAAVAGIARALLAAAGEQPQQTVAALLDKAPSDPGYADIAEALRAGSKKAVLLGNIAAHHPAQAELRALASIIARVSGATLGVLAEGGNSAGAWLAGAVPHREAGGAAASTAGLDWRAMAAAGMQAMILLNTEPEFDAIEPASAVKALDQAEFVVAINAYATETARQYADVILPLATYLETGGTFVNCEGRWQSFAGATVPKGEARPAWKILRVLGNLLNLSGFEQNTLEEVRQEVEAACAGKSPEALWGWGALTPTSAAGATTRLIDFPIYSVDGMVRRSDPLQQTRDARAAAMHLSAATAKQLSIGDASQVRVRQGGGEAVLPVVLDEAVPQGCVYIPGGAAATATLGGGFGPVEIARV